MHVEEIGGAGAPLLFIHGWGMHGGMWGGVLERLAQQHRVLAVDLPGHGLSGKGEGGREKGEGGRERRAGRRLRWGAWCRSWPRNSPGKRR